ncbi:hypothetical protein BGP76_10880 [Reichenbachiella sp. MSK19-1]|nr:hypothetical protein BGP76_10880 [Reichenbachiella sp. MSK19-1]
MRHHLVESEMNSLDLRYTSMNKNAMKAETLKLGIIERLMKVQDTSTLQRMDQLITQAEMETRTLESMEAIERRDVVSIHEMRRENKEWIKGNTK